MFDDDIVCLGSSLASEAAFQQPILGVILHVEKSAESEEYSMLFKRANTTVVNIGRRSGSDPDRRFDEDLTSAMFRCAVVSRKHAKIVFSDSGHAYIVDSSSHHGTHVRKAGEAASKMLKPETSTLLSDGDEITFGKAVGKGDEWVTPIVVRVELYYGGLSFKPSPLSSPISEKSSSGRYGLDDSASSSSDDSSSDSDIEEIPDPSTSPSKPSSQPQSQNCIDLETREALIQNHVSTAYSAFKRLLTPALRKLPSVSEIIGDRSNVNLLDPNEGCVTLPAPVARRASAGYPIGFDASQHDIFELPMPTSSPIAMDIGTPSSSANLIISRPLSVPYSQGRRSPFSSVSLHEESHDAPLPLSPDACWSPASPPSPHLPIPPDASLPQTSSALPEESPSLPPPPVDISQDPSGSLQNAVSPNNEVTEMRHSLQSLQTTVNKLRFSRRKYKTRFNTNVSFISRKLSEIDDKFAEVDAEYNVLCDQVEGISHDEIPDIAMQLEQLEDRIKVLEWAKTCEDSGIKLGRSEPFEELEDAAANTKTMNEMVEEIRELKKTTEAAMAKQLTNIDAIREQALKDIEKAKADVLAAVALSSSMPSNLTSHQGVQTPVLTLLKRKRDDTDENEDQGVDEDDTDLSSSSHNEDMVVDDCPSGPIEQVHHHEMPPPRKRARRILSVMTQTATAVTIGAVVTWTALAFS